MTELARNAEDVRVELQFPLAREKETKLHSVTFRGVVTVDDMEAVDKAPVEEETQRQIHLLAELSGLPTSLIERMRSVDYFRCSRTVDEITARGASPAQVTPTADGGAVVRLRFPIQDGGKQVDTVTLKGVVTVADLCAKDKARGNVGAMKAMIARLSGLSPEAVGTMRAVDYVDAGKATEGIIMGNGLPPTGGTS